MQKKTTLNNFKVLQLKTIITILVLSFLFQGTYAQNNSLTLSTGKKNFQPSELPAIQKMLDAKQDKKVAASNSGISVDVQKVQADVPLTALSGKFNHNIAGFGPPTVPNVACTFTGSLLAGDLTMPNRLFRPGTAGGTCAAAQPFPGTFSAGLYFYDTWSFTNTNGAAACVTVTLTTNDLTNANIQHGAWLGSFNPANLAANYMADPYVSTGTPAAPAGISFSFNLPNAATVIIAVWSANPNTTSAGTANDYTLSVDGLCNLCPQPPCTPPTNSTISAVAIPFTEGFDGAIPPAGWTATNHSSPLGVVTWNQGAANGVFPPHSGAGYASVNFNSGGGLATINNWMIAPAVTLKNGDQFKFWTRAATGGGVFPDRLQVRMSTNGASTNVGTLATDVGDFSTLLLDINPTYSPSPTTGYPEVWTQYTATVSGVPAAGISGRMAFRYFVENGGPAGGNSNYIGIDDVQYVASGTPTVCPGGTGFIKVDITGGISPYVVVIHPTPGVDFTVPNYTSGSLIPVVVPVATTYTLVSVASTSNCTSCAGGTLSGTATIGMTPTSTAAVLSQVLLPPVPSTVFNEGFEGAIPPAGGWAMQNLSNPIGTNPTWIQGGGLGVFPPHSGVGFASSNFNAVGGLGTISNWLFAPNVTLRNGDVFSFWTRTTTGTFPDRMQVRMSTNGASVNAGATNVSVGDFTTLLLDINPTYTSTGYPTAWTQFTLTLSGLPAAGVSGRIAFRYFVENGGPPGSNSDFIGVDDAVYQTTVPGAPPTTCTGSTANLKVDITGGNSPYTVVINAAPATPGYPRTITGYVSGDYIPVTPAFTTTYNLVSVTSADGCPGSGNSGTPTITVSATPVSPITIVDNPTGPLCAGDPKLLTVIGAPTAGSCTTNSGAITVNVPDASATGAISTLNVACVPATAVGTGASVTFNLTHTWDSDMSMFLKAPNGQVLNLVDRVGGSGDNFTNTVINSVSANPLALGAAPFTGTFAPSGNLASPAPTGYAATASTFVPLYNTTNLNGPWVFAMRDNAGGDLGILTSWGLTLNYNVPAGPPVGYTFLWTPASGLSSTTTNPVAASPMTTTTYTVMGTAPGGCQTTAAITITVNQLPAVTTQPTNVTACAGSTVTFSAAGTGAGISYQWQVSTNGGGTYTNIANVAPYSGVTTPTLTINPVTVAMTTYRYRLVISGTCPPAANSTGAILTVVALPVVTISPASPVCGGTAGVNGTALTATGASSYVWTPNGAGSGLYTNAGATTVYTGTNLSTVYAAPTANTIYTVNGTSSTTGCVNSATISVIYTPAAPTVTPAAPAICVGSIQPLSISSSLTSVTTPFCSGPINVAIPEGNFPAPPPTAGVSTIPVSGIPAGAVITALSVTSNITHNYVGDVVMVLKAPNGQVFNLDALLSATNNPGSNFVNNVISSTGTTALSAGTAPFTGTFKADAVGATFTAFGFTLAGGPVGYTPTTTSWANLYSVPNGNWTLAMYDAGAPDVGNLTSWCLNITYGVPSSGIWTPNGPTGTLYTDPAATIFYTGTPANTVYAKPAVTTTYNVTVSSAGPDAFQTFTNPALITINNVGTATPYPANVVVSGLPTTGSSVKSVTLTGLNHTWSDDVDIMLQSPTGQNVILMSDIGAANLFNNLTYTFDDSGAPLAGTSPSGTYHPTNVVGAIGVEPDNFPAPGPGPLAQPTPALAMFGNTNDVNGTWRLLVVDDAAGDQGTITGGFSITFAYPTVGCPSPATAVTVTVNNPATITSQPVNTTVCTDKVATFSVTATGTALTYQWQVSTDNGNTFSNISNGGVYSGATSATLVITAPPVSMNGYAYRVLIQGALPCPGATSFYRILTVNPLPTVVISASPYTRLYPGLTTTLSSTVTPFAAGAGGYVWLRNGVQVAGANTGTLVVNVDALGDYRLRVTDVNGCTNTSNLISITDSVSGRCFIYPNPSSGQFQVRYYSALNNVLPRGVVVYDAKGDQILSKSYIVGRPYDRMDVDLRKNGKGLYWVEVVDMNGNRLTMCRVVIQ